MIKKSIWIIDYNVIYETFCYWPIKPVNLFCDWLILCVEFYFCNPGGGANLADLVRNWMIRIKILPYTPVWCAHTTEE